MASSYPFGPATPGELTRLAQSYAAEADSDEQLAAALRGFGGMPLAVEANERRARKHRRTADILSAFARELGIRAEAPASDLQAAE